MVETGLPSPLQPQHAERASRAGRTSGADRHARLSRRSRRRSRRRAIEVAELDIEVVGRRLEVLGAEIGRGARDVARVGLLDGELADRLALHLVGLEQRRPGDACRAPARASRRDCARRGFRCCRRSRRWAASDARHRRRGRRGRRWNWRATSEVARQRAMPSILTGRLGSPAPARTNSINRCLADVGGGIRRGFRILLRIADRVHRQEARLAVLVHAEEAAERRVVDVDHAQRLAQQLRREIGVEVDRDAVGEDAAPVEFDVEQLAHLAVGAVGADQVFAAQLALARRSRRPARSR